MADAATAAWDAKFRDDCWRPITGIREADTDGNPATAPDPGWTPQGCPGGGIVPDFTPAFPAYPSGHATFGQAVFTVLKRFYGTDAVSFTLTSEELPGQTRQYSSFSQAAQENADSRVWLGVHWRFDQTAGQALGQSIADFIADTRFEPVAAPGEDLAWTLQGPEEGTGYTPVTKAGAYTINGRYEVRVASDFLRSLTPANTFNVLVAGGPLVGSPVNAVGGRLATADGYGSFRLVIAGSTLVLDDFQLAPGVVESFEGFAAAHGVAADPDADPDGDGRGNFAEYAFGTSPAAADHPPIASRELLDGQDVLVVRYLRRPGRELAGLTLEAQRSEDLGDWNTQGVTDETDPDAAPVAGAEPRRAWFRIDASGTGFLRLWARME